VVNRRPLLHLTGAEEFMYRGILQSIGMSQRAEHSGMRGVEQKTSAALVMVALASYLFYVFHSMAVRGFIAELSRLSQKFMFSG